MARFVVRRGFNHRAASLSSEDSGTKPTGAASLLLSPLPEGRAPNLWVGIDRFFFFLHNLNACRTFRNGGNPCRLPSNGSSKEESPYTSDCRPSETSAPERSR